MTKENLDMASTQIGCGSCARAFLSDEALSHHTAAVHGDSAAASPPRKSGAATQDIAKHQHTMQGSQGSTAVASLGCDRCNRGFYTVQGLKDHASMVHDKALDDNNTTYSEKERLVREALLAKVGKDARGYQVYTWISDMTDAWVVYSVEGNENLLKAEYTITDNVVTVGDPSEVRRKTVYETVGSS